MKLAMKMPLPRFTIASNSGRLRLTWTVSGLRANSWARKGSFSKGYVASNTSPHSIGGQVHNQIVSYRLAMKLAMKMPLACFITEVRTGRTNLYWVITGSLVSSWARKKIGVSRGGHGNYNVCGRINTRISANHR